jgi:hypothetical protein
MRSGESYVVSKGIAKGYKGGTYGHCCYRTRPAPPPARTGTARTRCPRKTHQSASASAGGSSCSLGRTPGSGTGWGAGWFASTTALRACASSGRRGGRRRFCSRRSSLLCLALCRRWRRDSWPWLRFGGCGGRCEAWYAAAMVLGIARAMGKVAMRSAKLDGWR